MIDFYFAVSKSMVEANGMPQVVSNSNYVSWNLKHDTYLNYLIADSPGKVLDALVKLDLNSFPDPVAICHAISDDSYMIEVLRCALAGDSISKLPVIIVELTWINNHGR